MRAGVVVAAFTLLVALVGAVPGKVYNTAGGPVAGKVNVHIVPHTHDGTYVGKVAVA